MHIRMSLPLTQYIGYTACNLAPFEVKPAGQAHERGATVGAKYTKDAPWGPQSNACGGNYTMRLSQIKLQLRLIDTTCSKRRLGWLISCLAIFAFLKHSLKCLASAPKACREM